MNWNNLSLVVLGLSAFAGAFTVALWISLVIWTFRDMRARSRDAFAQLLAALMVLVLGPFGAVLYLVLRPRETLAEKYERSLEEEALLQDIEERQICPGCKQPIERDFMICPICHVTLRQPCVDCERLIHPRWSVCPYCGTNQKPATGVEGAAKVTLLDLQGQAFEPSVALEPDLEPVYEQVEPDEQETETSEDQPDFASAWGSETEEETEGDPLADFFSEEDEASQIESAEADADPETETTDDGTPRRPLSLFRRP